LWLVLVLCTYWEPVTRDGWGNTYYYVLHDLSPGEIVAYVGDSWRTGNPRLGQTWTLLMYAPGPFHVITTPLLELAMFALLTAVALGRWPSLRRADDVLVALAVTAVVAACAPKVGALLFYRPFTGNYVFGLVLNLAWLIPYRFGSNHRAWLAPVLLVLGVAAGMCNEHTGVAFLAMGGFATVTAWHAGNLRPWMIAGLAGLAIGYVLLLVAPGHAYRYDGLAKQAGIVGRIADRGVAGNLRVVWISGFYLLPALAWLAIGVAARRGRRYTAADRWPLVLACGGLLCTLVLLASPKLGGRLYLASVALTGTAIAAWVCTRAAQVRWARLACIALSAGALVYGAARCLAIYAAVGPVGAERMRIIVDTPNGQHVVVPRYPVGPSRWFLGEDLDERMRKALATDYGLTGIDLAPR
jgi:hypothetical protein